MPLVGEWKDKKISWLGHRPFHRDQAMALVRQRAKPQFDWYLHLSPWKQVPWKEGKTVKVEHTVVGVPDSDRWVKSSRQCVFGNLKSQLTKGL